MMSIAEHRRTRFASIFALAASPAVVIFLSSNFVNVGNLVFNMMFSRWMGPELFGDLAVVLTIKLALLGILGALSSAVSHQVAAQGDTGKGETERTLARINRLCFIALWIALPVVSASVYAGSLDARLDLGSPYLLYILILSLPFCAPLNLLRGVALGRMDSKRIVFSANVEMAVRLGFGVVAWHVGLGIEGVVAAIGLSIFAGWAVLARLLPEPGPTPVNIRPIAITLGLAALPFALLQLAQVVALDGDIFLATHYLDDAETGYVAALSLFQRIQFYACFALAGVLLPSVVIASREGRSIRSSVAVISTLLAVVSSVVMLSAAYAPATLLSLLVGADYVAASGYLVWVAAAAVAFTINYLIATFLLAKGLRSGVAVVVAGAAIQIGLMIAAISSPDGTLVTMLTTKLFCQFGVLVVLVVLLWTLSHKSQIERCPE